MFKKRLLPFNFSYFSFFVSFVFLLLMQYQLWFGTGSLRDNFKIKKQIEWQLLINKQKLESNNSLYSKINAFKRGDAGVIGQARYDLGMIKAGEDYFQFRQDDKTS
jgi:cell division protein FtsB